MKTLVRFSSCLSLVAICLAALGVAPAVAGQVTFLPTGAEQTFVVPADVTSVHALAVGGRGADVTSGGKGGSGALVGADISVTPGQTLYIEVGGNGSGMVGGFNGGAAGGSGNGGGGGGATDIRTAPRAAGTSLGLRLLVAGGGGGGGASTPGPGTTNYGGSAGPSPTFGTGYSIGGAPGTSLAGGAGGSGYESGSAGTLATGGQGGPGGGGTAVGGGGGGGGLYGGGGGGSSSAGSGGGPGSSYFGTGVTNMTIATDTTGLPSISLTYSAGTSAPVVPPVTVPPVTTPPATTPPVVTPPPVATPPSAKPCKVPDLSGRSLKAARKVLTAASCKVGTVKRKFKGARKVVGQTPKSGRSLAPGAAVNVTLGSGRRR